MTMTDTSMPPIPPIMTAPAPEPVPNRAVLAASYGVYALAAAAILSGLACAAENFAHGAPMAAYVDCLIKVGVGIGIYSPGVASYKAGPFAR